MYPVTERIPYLRLGVTNLFRCRIAAQCHCPPEFGWDPTKSWTRSARAGWARCIARGIHGWGAMSPLRSCLSSSPRTWTASSALSAKRALFPLSTIRTFAGSTTWEARTDSNSWSSSMSRANKEIFYSSPDNKIMAAEKKTSGASLEVGTVRPLFEARLTRGGAAAFDVTANGQRFVILEE